MAREQFNPSEGEPTLDRMFSSQLMTLAKGVKDPVILEAIGDILGRRAARKPTDAAGERLRLEAEVALKYVEKKLGRMRQSERDELIIEALDEIYKQPNDPKIGRDEDAMIAKARIALSEPPKE